MRPRRLAGLLGLVALSILLLAAVLPAPPACEAPPAPGSSTAARVSKWTGQHASSLAKPFTWKSTIQATRSSSTGMSGQ